MTTLLPSQRQDRMYVGPQGMLIREQQPVIEESDDASSEDDEDQPKAAKLRWQQAKKNLIDESIVLGAMKDRVREASHGVSTTRGATSKLADQLAGALSAAALIDAGDGPSLVQEVEDQCQIEILSALPVASTRAATRVCKAWHEAFNTEESGLWQQIIAAASARAVATATARLRASSAGGSWVALGKQMQAEAFALRARWLSGTCGEAVLRGVHADYVMSMCLHDGTLITSAADKSIALTDVSRHTRRTHVGKLAGGPREDEDDEVGGGHNFGVGGRSAHDRGSVDGGGGGSAGSDAAAASSGGGSATRMLYGHRGQVLCVHAFGAHLASCSSDGDTLIWRLPTDGDDHPDDGGVHRRHRFGRCYALAMEARGVVCGSEGRVPVTMYDWRDGEMLFEAPDEAPPLGMTTCVLRPPATPLLVAGNSDAHSQLRVWDVRHGRQLRDRFNLPAHCKGVRCVAAPSEATLLGGTTNGWVLLFDLRSGRFERRFAHADCCNALCVSGHYLVSAGDDKVVRITDLRKHSFSPLGAHRVRSVIFAACADSETIYVGCDAGDIRIFDYSAEANPETATATGGFTAQQKAALSAALEAVQRGSPSRPAHRTPGRIRPAASAQ